MFHIQIIKYFKTLSFTQDHESTSSESLRHIKIKKGGAEITLQYKCNKRNL